MYGKSETRLPISTKVDNFIKIPSRWQPLWTRSKDFLPLPTTRKSAGNIVSARSCKLGASGPLPSQSEKRTGASEKQTRLWTLVRFISPMIKRKNRESCQGWQSSWPKSQNLLVNFLSKLSPRVHVPPNSWLGRWFVKFLTPRIFTPVFRTIFPNRTTKQLQIDPATGRINDKRCRWQIAQMTGKPARNSGNQFSRPLDGNVKNYRVPRGNGGERRNNGRHATPTPSYHWPVITRP